MFSDIDLKRLRALQEEEAHTIVDVRSPGEFYDATIPGSINIPIFSDAERAEVGTLYKQVGPKAAEERGLEIFSAKLPAFIQSFKQIDTPTTVFCWRGGMRSKTAATVLDLMGIKVNRLIGGYRTYREWAVDTLATLEFKPTLYVLNGYTGSGKTVILKQLEKEGYPVMDLEGMANHRGSIFGEIGLEGSNQKRFDAQLVEKLLAFQEEDYVFIEGESKRIGKVTMPDHLFQKKEESIQIFIHLPLEERIKHILEDYQPWDYPEKIIEAYKLIKKRIHTPIAKEIEEDLKSENYAHAVELLLTYYYDPQYKYSAITYPAHKIINITAKNTQEATNKIKQTLAGTKQHQTTSARHQI